MLNSHTSGIFWVAAIIVAILLGVIVYLSIRLAKSGKQKKGIEGRFQPFYEHTRQILSKLQVPGCILVDKGFSDPDQVFIPVLEEQDVFLIDYAQKLIHNTGAQVTIVDASGILKVHDAARERIRSIEQKASSHIALNSTAVITSESLKGRNLRLISLNSGKTLIESKSSWLSDISSTLVIADKPE